MRVVRSSRSVSSWDVRLRTLRRQIAEELNLLGRRRDKERLQHIRMSRINWITMLLLILLMLFVMAVGVYLGHIFKGRVIEVQAHPQMWQPRFKHVCYLHIAQASSHAVNRILLRIA